MATVTPMVKPSTRPSSGRSNTTDAFPNGRNASRRSRVHHASAVPSAGPDKGEQQRLRQELADDAAAAGAECEAQGDLAPSRSAAGEQQVGDVGARGSQHEPDEAHQEVERAREPPPHVVLALTSGVSGECLGIGHWFTRLTRRPSREPSFAGGVLEDRLERRANLRRRCPWGEAAHDAQPPIPGLCPRGAVGLKAQVMSEWNRHVRRFAGLHRPVEALRRHADDGHRDPVHLDGLPEDIGVATEAALPVAEGNDGHRFRRGPVVFERDRAPEKGWHTQTVVIAPRDQLGRRTRLGFTIHHDVDL